MAKRFAPNQKQRKGPSFKIEDLIRYERDNSDDNHLQVGGNNAGSSSNNSNNNDGNQFYWNNQIVHQKESFTKTSEKLKFSRHSSTFEFQRPEDSSNYSYFDELKKYVSACIKRVLEEGEKKFGTIDRIGFQVNSDSLDFDLAIPLAPLTANSVDSFLNRFEIVDVSF